eukprot:jgi/Galph1/1344/GphlegSOOS_G6119.1
MNTCIVLFHYVLYLSMTFKRNPYESSKMPIWRPLCIKLAKYCPDMNNNTKKAASTSAIVVFTGPSGAGKSSIVAKLKAAYPNWIGFSVSHTTRSPRQGERHGVDYYFVSKQTMKEMIARNDGPRKLYGTSIQAVQQVVDEGNLCVLDIDVQGCRSIRKKGINAKIIFISPPSLSVLESRLCSRNTESESDLKKRLEDATTEMSSCEEAGLYDHVIVNDDLDKAFEEYELSLCRIDSWLIYF